VSAKAEMNTELFGTLIYSKGRGTINGSSCFGNDLDGNILGSDKVLGLEDHAEGAMV